MTHSKPNQTLPQLNGQLCISDGGLETVFVFQKNIELPLFASVTLLDHDEGREALRDYYLPYIGLALRHGTGIILDTATWRASHGWAEQLGYSVDKIHALNQRAVDLVVALRDKYAAPETPVVINGVIGPQDDGYQPNQLLDADAAERYHQPQIDLFADNDVDMVTAVTMTYADEAIGIVRAARTAKVPVAISFTVETDGRLPDGTALADAIRTVDTATDSAAEYFMVNCAHPSHFADVLDGDADWTRRIVGIRANASCKSHAELDEATELDQGNPIEFGKWYVELANRLPNLKVVGGCCGTDHRHIGEVCRSYLAAA